MAVQHHERGAGVPGLGRAVEGQRVDDGRQFGRQQNGVCPAAGDAEQDHVGRGRAVGGRDGVPQAAGAAVGGAGDDAGGAEELVDVVGLAVAQQRDAAGVRHVQDGEEAGNAAVGEDIERVAEAGCVARGEGGHQGAVQGRGAGHGQSAEAGARGVAGERHGQDAAGRLGVGAGHGQDAGPAEVARLDGAGVPHPAAADHDGAGHPAPEGAAGLDVYPAAARHRQGAAVVHVQPAAGRDGHILTTGHRQPGAHLGDL